MNNKTEFVPLHKRIQASSKKKHLEDIAARNEELNDIYKIVFESDEGQLLLEHLVDAYVGKIPARNSTPEEIMFAAGERYIVLDILKRIRRK